MFLILHTLFGVLLHKFRQNKVFIQQSIVWIWNFVRCNLGLPAVVSDLLFCCRLVAAPCLQDRKKVAMRMATFLNARRSAFSDDADRTQTCNLLIRSQMLYSIKLRRHSFIASANVGWLTDSYKSCFGRQSPVFCATVSFGLHVGLHNLVKQCWLNDKWIE